MNAGARMNPQQQLAVDTLEGALLLLAGAGTGKTTVIIHRIANLLTHGYPPESILAVTFTNKAAREMRERLTAMVGADVSGRLTVSTFHSFCCRILREHAPRLGFARNFSLVTESYQKGLVRELMGEAGQVGEKYDPAVWLHEISLAKSRMEGPEEMRERNGFRMAEKAQIYEKYQQRLLQMNLMDFDDLLCLTLRLWRENPAILRQYQERYRQIMIDEYQDTNAVQLMLMLELAGAHGNIAVVGDDDQSIYGWRGASLGNITDFESFFPEAKVIRLEQNYRSTGRILAAANAVIGHNRVRRAKRLWTESGAGEPIQAVQCADEIAEANFVVRYAREMNIRRRSWKALAVLFRSNYQARALEQQLARNRIPYVIVGANSFYQNKEILDAVSFLHCVLNPRDDMDFLRVVNLPPRGVGDTTIMRLRELGTMTRRPLQDLAGDDEACAGLPQEALNGLRTFLDALQHARRAFAMPGDLCGKCRRFFDELDYLEGLGRIYKPREDALRRRDNVMEFLNSLAEYDRDCHGGGTLEGFLEQMALDGDRRDKKETADDAVSLMTIHAAKGLEFPEVILTGCERNILPNARAVEEGNEEEERRLFYVAITRARQKLVVSYADARHVAGRLVKGCVSPLVDELPREDLSFTKPEKAFAPMSQADAIAMLSGLTRQEP